MKHSLLLTALIAFTTLFLVSDAYAQFSGGWKNRSGRCIERLNLTEGQLEKMNELRLNHREEMIKLRADLELKQLELQKLTGSTDLTRSKYLSVNEEMTIIKNKISEARANHKMDIYELLDDTQKKEFFNTCGRSGFGEGRTFDKKNRMRRG